MPKKRQAPRKQKEPQEKRSATPTFLLELPLVVDPGQAARLRAHLEVARQLYNAILSQGQKRLRRMRADPSWQAARTLPHTHKVERAAAFSTLRKAHGFTEAALHEAVKALRVGWIAEHLEAVLAQTLATRAYRALNQVCLARPHGCASRAGGEVSQASRTSATIRGCALCCIRQKKGMRGS